MKDQAQRAGRILVIEDEAIVRDTLTTALTADGYTVDTAGDGQSALATAASADPEIVLLDLGLPDSNGLDLIPHLREYNPVVGIIVATGQDEISIVVSAMNRGADNFLVKPIPLEHLTAVVGKTLTDRRRERHHRSLLFKAQAGEESAMIGSSKPSLRVRELMKQVADTDATVLLLGDSGTGKSLAAGEIHRLSNRWQEPFMDINCAGLSSNLLESELFGHEAGAFTDARRSKPGLMEVASGGTVFLDEIAEMPTDVQSKLLKVLEQQKFRRLGGVRDIVVDIRLIAATNRNLKDRVDNGDFREDLYYRLNVFSIELPPLRDRPEEILELAHHYLGVLNRKMGTNVQGIAPTAESMLLAYGWPGNVREILNVIERAVILARSGPICPHHLPSDLRGATPIHSGKQLRSLSQIEEEAIRETLDATGGNVKRTSEILQVSRSTLYAKLQAYEIRTGKD